MPLSSEALVAEAMRELHITQNQAKKAITYLLKTGAIEIVENESSMKPE